MNGLQVYQGTDLSYRSTVNEIFGNPSEKYYDSTFTCVTEAQIKTASVWVLRSGTMPTEMGNFNLQLMEFRLYSCTSLVEYAIAKASLTVTGTADKGAPLVLSNLYNSLKARTSVKEGMTGNSISPYGSDGNPISGTYSCYETSYTNIVSGGKIFKL